LWASKRRAISWLRPIEPSHLAMRNNLDCDSFGLRACVINHVVYVPAADIGECLAYCVGLRRASGIGGVVDRDRSLCHCDQTGTRMRVPASLASCLPGILGNIEVGIASHSCGEKPSRQIASTHQIEEARREVAGRHRG
jgi:hypothetical protein